MSPLFLDISALANSLTLGRRERKHAIQVAFFPYFRLHDHEVQVQIVVDNAIHPTQPLLTSPALPIINKKSIGVSTDVNTPPEANYHPSVSELWSLIINNRMSSSLANFRDFCLTLSEILVTYAPLSFKEVCGGNGGPIEVGFLSNISAAKYLRVSDGGNRVWLLEISQCSTWFVSIISANEIVVKFQ